MIYEYRKNTYDLLDTWKLNLNMSECELLNTG